MNTRFVTAWVLLGFCAWSDARVAGQASGLTPTPSSTSSRFGGFTEPVRQIDVAVAEPGRVAEVHVRRGATVAAGDLLLGLELGSLEPSRRLAEVKSKLTARLKALEVEARLRRNRHEKLLDLQAAGAGSSEEVKRARADAEVAQLEVVAEENARQLNQLELEEIEARIESRQVRSPIRGVVTDVLKEVGEFVAVTEPEVVRIVELNTLRVTFHIPTGLVEAMSEGSIARLEFPDTHQTTTGTIEYVGQTTDAESGRVRVDILIDNENRPYRSGVRCEWIIQGRLATQPNMHANHD